MNNKNLFEKLTQGPLSTTLAVSAVVITWGLAIIFVVLAVFLYTLEQPGRAAEATPGPIPAITLEPASGRAGTLVTVRGEGWPVNSTVLIHLSPIGQSQIPTYAVASAVVDPQGAFAVSFVFPTEARWENQTQAMIVARAENSNLTAQANFDLVRIPIQPTNTPTAPVEPTATPTVQIEPTPTLEIPTATPTPQPIPPTVTATANLNVRDGPGVDYPILGLLRRGQSAEVTGVNPDGGWWQISFPGATNNRAWVSAAYTTSENIYNIPVVQASPPPVPPTPTPTPLPAITAWRGEYFNNIDLAGAPVVVRNDNDLNFNWETGSPAPNLPTDNFSARWTRTESFNEGWYGFHAIVDDGVRLYVDNTLVLDNWNDGSPHEVTGYQWLSAGDHNVRVEYYEHTGGALIQVWWVQVAAPPAVSSAPSAPEADFEANHRSGQADLTVEFHNKSDGVYDSCDWSFGDGDTSDDCDDVSHTYHHPGRYSVRLEVSGPGGHDTKTRHDYITVYHRLRADFRGGPTSGTAPLTVQFTNLSRGDYNADLWSFGDGSTSHDLHNPSHVYTTPGDYTVTLKVDGRAGTQTKTKANYITVLGSPSLTPTPTNTPIPPTATPTPTSTPIPATPTPTPTNTPVPPTATPTPSNTPIPPTPNSTPTPTNTLIPPTSTPTPTNTPIPPTATPTPTNTPIPPTATPTPRPKGRPGHASSIPTPRPKSRPRSAPSARSRH